MSVGYSTTEERKTDQSPATRVTPSNLERTTRSVLEGAKLTRTSNIVISNKNLALISHAINRN